MAMIDKIRKKKELLLIMIGLGMIGFLIPYDAVMALFGKGGPSTVDVARIDGESITLDDYQRRLQTRKAILNYGSDDALEGAVWNDLLEEKILGDDFEDLGLYIGKDEYDEIRFGDRTSTFVNSVFYGGAPTPEAKNNLRTTFSQWYNGTYADQQIWMGYKEVITIKRQREKYDALIGAGAYMNSIDAKSDDVMKNQKVDIEFVVMKYTEIPDSTISYTERDVKAYYEKHKKEEKYKQTAGRSIEYVSFDVKPTSADSAAIVAELGAQQDNFQSAENDSLFVITQSDVPVYSKAPYRKGDNTDASVDSTLVNAAVGSVAGPYLDKGAYKLAKIQDRKMVPEVNARHILLQGSEDQMDELKARADSLKRVAKRDNNFADLAKEFSKDPGSGAKGGDLDWFGKGKMVAPFEEACFNGKVGDMPVVQSQFGVHLIEIMDRREVEETTIATIQRNIGPSPKTLDEAYRTTNDWVINHSTEAEFRESADSLGIQEAKGIAPNSKTIAGIAEPSGVIGWAYKAEKGEISSPILSGNKYIVALLTGITEDGVPDFDTVKEQMEEEVKKEKKAEYYMDIMSKGANLQEVATAVNKTVQKAAGLAMSSSAISGGGANEHVVIGTAFFLEEGEMSYPIKGENGVYVIAPVSAKTEFTPKEDYSTDVQTLSSRAQSRAKGGAGIFNALQKAADVKDDRRKF